MSSILTNNGAMVALQTMKSINKNLGQVQSEISTGKSVANAKDNAAVWAISKVMESDVKAFKGISDSLALGSSTVGVGQKAAETVTDLLNKVKSKIVAAQEANVPRDKIQADINALRDQISATVGAAQLGGLNLLSNKETAARSGSVDILASLDRSANGVGVSKINVVKQDLGLGASSLGAAPVVVLVAGALATGPTPAQGVALFAGPIVAGTGFNVAITAGTGNAASANTATVDAIRYVARDGDTAADVARGLAAAFNTHIEGTMGADRGTVGAVASGNNLTFTGSTGVALANDMEVEVNSFAGSVIGGGLEGLNDINVESDEGAARALLAIETMIQTGIDAAAAFGSVRGRIETQQDFVGNLVDAMRTGIGSMVDANMEEASARLQALQVQQQLATQSLSIANQAPQNILALFR